MQNCKLSVGKKIAEAVGQKEQRIQVWRVAPEILKKKMKTTALTVMIPASNKAEEVRKVSEPLSLDIILDSLEPIEPEDQ